MKKILSGLAIIVIAVSCKKEETTNPHIAGADCGKCHASEQTQWASSENLHAASVANVLSNADHNTAELLTNDCLKCHSMFQYQLGVSHFVTPVDQVGSPAGTWTALNASEWQATKCEVCHDPTATNKSKLAKFGSLLDGAFSAGYTNVSALPSAYQTVLNQSTGVFSTYNYPDQTAYNVQATKLCNSCHDPADQGGDPEIIRNGISYGAQGGDSRAYVADNHQGFGCIDCHTVHTFLPVNPQTTTGCITCHTGTKTGKVHINHL